jgi:hypothetical protein
MHMPPALGLRKETKIKIKGKKYHKYECEIIKIVFKCVDLYVSK